MTAVPKPKHRAQKKRFAHRRSPEYQAWVRRFPCWFCKKDGTPQRYPTECEHLKTRASGGDDFNNIIPTCAVHRERRDQLGPKTFFGFYSPNVWEAARNLTKVYQTGSVVQGVPASPGQSRAHCIKRS